MNDIWNKEKYYQVGNDGATYLHNVFPSQLNNLLSEPNLNSH